MIGVTFLLVAGLYGEARAQIACGSAAVPLCDGACPTGQDCEEQSGVCVCQPTTDACGVDAGPPLCYGLCPPAAPICADVGGTCACIGGSTPTPGGPIATPTVTPTPAVSDTPTCAALPVAGCRTPTVGGKASILIKKQLDDDKDRLVWKWLKGSATSKDDFGNPTVGTSYTLCVYDGASNLILSSVAIGGDSCEGVPCWQDKPTGFKYKDRDNSPNGPRQILLKEGLAGKAKIIVKGRGSDLDPPPPPLTQPVTVQLVNTDGVCWEAVYSEPAIKNVAGPPGQFKDKAD